MKNCVFKAFTLLEVIVSLFVFSTGMLAYMSYHVRANEVMFENESAQIAHSLALNLAEEIVAMEPKDFYELSKDREDGNSTWLDTIFFDSEDKSAGPFDSRGKPGSNGENFQFYRFLRFSTYDKETDTFNPAPSIFGKLRHVEIIVSWPFKQHGANTDKCGTVSYFMSNSNQYCNYITIPVVRFAEYD